MAKVVLTRALEDSRAYAAELGLDDLLIFPALEFLAPADNYAALDAAIRRNPDYSWIVFLSQKAAEIFFERLIAIGGHTFHLHPGLKIACIGEATRRYIETEIGFPVDFSPSEFNSDVFVEEFPSGIGFTEMRILVPRTAMVSDDFARRLSQRALMAVDIVEAYTTRCPDTAPVTELEQALRQGALVSFTSSQIVRNFMQLSGSLPRDLLASARAISLGPKTTKTLMEYQVFSSIIEAKPSTLDAMAAVIKSTIDEQSKTRP